MDWKHGYFTGSGYTYGFFEETTPARLAWVATLKGHRSKSEEFRYIDLGCGQGFNLIQLAALHPKSEFVGIDFMPSHIAHAQRLAKDAELSNVKFYEADFLNLAEKPFEWGEFDFVVAHGITTWVSENVKEALFRLAQAILKPGGVMYNSYNTYPGWLHAAAFQNLVLRHQSRLGGEAGLLEAKNLVEKLHNAGGAIYSSLPGLQGRINEMEKQDLSYLVQEYNNQSWRPVFSNEMLELALKNKLSFLGSATLAELFDAFYQDPLRKMINQETDPITRETVRDLAVFQSFRRDVYVKGESKYWPQQQNQVIKEQRFVVNDSRALPPEGEQFSVRFGNTKVSGERAAYLEIIEAFGIKGNSIADVIQSITHKDFPSLVQKVSLLLQGGWLALEGQNSTVTAPQLNRSVALAVMQGAPYQYLCAPKLQSAISISNLDFMLIALSKKGESSSDLTKKLVKAMLELGKRFTENGIAIEDSAKMMNRASDAVNAYLSNSLKCYQRLGSL